MRRILLKVSIFALSFGLGHGVSAFWQLDKWSQLPLDAGSTVCDVFVVEREPTEITIVGRMDACGPRATFHTMELSDGTRISQSCERLSSPAAAARALQRKDWVNAAIAERSQERDEREPLIGETILTTSPRVMRLSIYGNNLCVTDATSLNTCGYMKPARFIIQ